MTEVDARGLACPLPVVNTKKALEKIGEGKITVLVDSSESCQNVQRFARSQGCQVEVKESDGVICLDIARSQTVQARKKQNSDVVLITSDRLGIGSKKLGESLMESFTDTLLGIDPKPARLILLNAGVKLATKSSKVWETLQLLAENGVEIFSCGTCLEYYNLTDKLMVGQVTNMYDIIDTLLSAGKVITI